MLSGVEYDSAGRLVDDTGHTWRRTDSWVEPDDAEAAVAAGCRYLVQWCVRPPVRGRPERFRRDIKPSLLTRTAARTLEEAGERVTVLVAERWTSQRAGALLLFVEQGSYPRPTGDLVNGW